MGLNIYGELTNQHEETIEKRLTRAGFKIEDGGWSETINYLRESGQVDEYRRALHIFCRVVGMKPTMSASWGWGKFGIKA